MIIPTKLLCPDDDSKENRDVLEKLDKIQYEKDSDKTEV